MHKVTLSEAIEDMDNAFKFAPLRNYETQIVLILAAAKAFACERCNGEGVYDTGSDIFDCPECAEFRKIAREGVENDNKSIL